MYETKFRGDAVVRQLRLRQGRANNTAIRPMLDCLEDTANWFSSIPVDITVRYEDEGWQTFKATKIVASDHFPYIVPELVDESGDYLLISYLSFGSLLRLYNAICER